MPVKRRTYLRGLAALGASGAAGCLGSGDSNPNVELSEPDRQFDSEDVPYPAWGQQIPDVTVPAPLEDREVTLRSVDKPRLLTFFYSYCQTVCPVLVSTMRDVQTEALNEGYGDEVAFFPLTFDPERDTADRLREYAEKMHVDADASDWHFLRPASVDRENEVITEGFGVGFEKQSSMQSGNGNASDGGDGNATGSDGASAGYMFVHTPMTMLVNADDYVERAYRTKTPDADRILSDLEEVRTA